MTLITSNQINKRSFDQINNEIHTEQTDKFPIEELPFELFVYILTKLPESDNRWFFNRLSYFNITMRVSKKFKIASEKARALWMANHPPSFRSIDLMKRMIQAHQYAPIRTLKLNLIPVNESLIKNLPKFDLVTSLHLSEHAPRLCEIQVYNGREYYNSSENGLKDSKTLDFITQKFPNLEEIHLTYSTNFNSGSIEALCKLPKLRKFVLDNVSISNKCFETFKKFQNINMIECINCSDFSKDDENNFSKFFLKKPGNVVIFSDMYITN